MASPELSHSGSQHEEVIPGPWRLSFADDLDGSTSVHDNNVGTLACADRAAELAALESPVCVRSSALVALSRLPLLAVLVGQSCLHPGHS
ncbi:hypothetical protein N7471_009674 [Penicillium samsonianum]|uniref:uncharacterized protein n=1 Tax=Penicillium samsonianum TaxID=1882272 RepID=UPI002548C7D4|nr:uncharacterized protein N7471_009674 [Penicillium samsonianum]KAJ6128457.1 hypothetical protein N7471_009674 [Penicillium samsonianum]